MQNTEQEVRAIKKLISNDSKLIVVTDAVHMTRAKMLFRKAGFDVSAYPTRFFKGDKISPMTFIPSAKAFFVSSQAYREFQGRVFYTIKHAID